MTKCWLDIWNQGWLSSKPWCRGRQWCPVEQACCKAWRWYICSVTRRHREKTDTGEGRTSFVLRAMVSGPWNTNCIFREGSCKQFPPFLRAVGKRLLRNKTQQPTAADPFSVTKVLGGFTGKEGSVNFWQARHPQNWFAWSVGTILLQPTFYFLIIPLLIIIFLISICYPLGRGFLNSNIRLFLSQKNM